MRRSFCSVLAALLLTTALGSGCGASYQKKVSKRERQAFLQKEGYSKDEQTQYEELMRLKNEGGPKKEISEALELMKSKDVAVSKEAQTAFSEVFDATKNLTVEDSEKLFSAYAIVLATAKEASVTSSATALQSIVQQPSASLKDLTYLLRVGLVKLMDQDPATIAAYSALFSRLADNQAALLNLNALVDGVTSPGLTAVRADALTTLLALGSFSTEDIVVALAHVTSQTIALVSKSSSLVTWTSLGDASSYKVSLTDTTSGALVCATTVKTASLALGSGNDCSTALAYSHSFLLGVVAYGASGNRVNALSQSDLGFSLDGAPILSYSGAGGTVGALGSAMLITPGSLQTFDLAVSSCVVASGALPAGLSVNSSTCVVSGTPTAAGSFTAGIVASNSAGSSSAASLTLTVAAIVPTLSYVDSTGTSGSAGTAMSVSPTTLNTNGAAISGCAVSTGSLPTGVSVNPSTCVVSGTPTAAGSFTAGIVASNSAGSSSAASLSLTVAAAAPTLSYAGASGTSGAAGSALSVTPSTLNANGAAVSGCTVTTGALPAGVSVNTSTCVVSGTPTAVGSFTAGIVASNSAGSSSAASLTLTVSTGAPTLSYSGSLGKSAALNSAMSVTPSTLNINGEAITDCAVSTGSLPAGVSVNNSTCVVSGTPTAAGSFTVGIIASNSVGPGSAASLTLTVTSAQLDLSYSGATGTSTSRGVAMSVAPTTLVDYGKPLTSCVVSAGSLPTGVAINNITCLISGTPTVAKSYPVTVTATNSTGSTSADVMLTVTTPASGLTVTYDGNGNTGGSVPTDATGYSSLNTVTVLGNTGALTKTGYVFSGWTTSTAGTGTTYLAGETFSIAANTTLYASWAPVSATTYYVNDTSLVGDRFATAVGSDSNSGTSPGAPFRTMLQAATVAPEGSVILVDAGSYTGPMHIQYQGIKVLGPNFDISPVTGVRRAEASVNPLGASVAEGLADHISFTDTSSDSTFSGFEITGNSVSDKNAAVIMAGGFATHGGGDNMTISRNYIHDTNTPGIAITGAFFGNLTISDNKIVNTKLVTAWGGTYSAAIGANAIAATTTPWLITGNYISNSEGQGISAMHNLGVSITNNTILNTQMAGIDAPTGWSAARTFQSTIVSNNTIINANLAASATSGGIVVGAATNTYWDSYSFSGNTIINSSPGFYISASIGDLSTKLSFTNNRISGYGTTAIKHETAGTLNAANNWFGGVCEASIFSATGDGTVSFSPCLNP